MENVRMEDIEDDFNGELENYVSASMDFCLAPFPLPDPTVNRRAIRTKPAQADSIILTIKVTYYQQNSLKKGFKAREINIGKTIRFVDDIFCKIIFG